MPGADVVIIGGGIIGLSTAYALSENKLNVTVLDAGFAGQASTAAAGMLAPLAEADCLPNDFVVLARASLSLYPLIVAELKAKTGVDIEIGPGMLRVASDDEELDALLQAFEWQKWLGYPLAAIRESELRKIEPALSKKWRFGLLSSSERSIDPRLLYEAFKIACQKNKVSIHQDVTATGLDVFGDTVKQVITRDRKFPCDRVIVAGGAWTTEMGDWLHYHIPVEPVRGQILALGPSAPCLVNHTIYSPRGYLVPRKDGRIIVGATEENVGFQANTTSAGVTMLLNVAYSLVPDTASAPFHSAWAGLRPVSPDGLPIIGSIPGWSNVYVSTGHGRNGILLTPLTASAAMQFIVGGKVLCPQCSPSRFANTLL